MIKNIAYFWLGNEIATVTKSQARIIKRHSRGLFPLPHLFGKLKYATFFNANKYKSLLGVF